MFSQNSPKKIMKPVNSPGDKFQATNHSPKRFIPFQRVLTSLNSQSLSRQIIKRSNVMKWTFVAKGKDEKHSSQVQKKLRTILKAAKGMKKLTLDFSFRDWDYQDRFPRNGFLRYPHVLKRLKSLKQVTLYSKISNAKIGIYSLMRSLKGLSSLKTIHFNFSPERVRIKNECLCFISQRLKAFCSLKSLSLDLNAFHKEEGWELFGSFSRLTRLERLALRLNNLERILGKPSLSSFHFRSLVSLRFSSLKSLSLDLNGFYTISSKGWEELFGSFSCLTRLERLSLRLDNHERILDTSLSGFDFRSLVSLREINLSFSSCQSLTNKGIFFLTRDLKRLISLQNLHLNFSGCSKIDDQGFISLWKTITSLSSLEQLEVDFTGWSKLTEIGFRETRKTLKNLVKLQAIALSFTNCNQINGNFLSDLGSGLASLKPLKNLRLGFRGCDRILPFHVEEFIKELNYFQGFEVFALDFQHYDQEAIRNFVQSRGEKRIDWNGLFSLFGNPYLNEIETWNRY